MSKQFVVVAGNIGVGKTSLTQRVGERLSWLTGYETVVDNPYLADFYTDMAQYAFHLQVFLLGHRAQMHKSLFDAPKPAIIDRSIYEDAFIFARALHHMGTLSGRDYQAYRTIYDLVVAGLPRPDLLLYLKAPTAVLLDRIKERGRVMETGITTDYLDLLDSYYNEWIAEFDMCPVLTIHTQNLDFVSRPDHLDIVVQRIQDKLMGHEDVVLT